MVCVTPQTPTNRVHPTRLGVVLKGYPRLSETFIAQEILNLERSGFEISLYSLRHPTDTATHPVNDEINASVNYLPEYLYQEPRRVFSAWIQARQYKGYAQAFSAFIKDLKRDFGANRIRRFGQALVLAAELDKNISALYAHFLHTPASVARYGAMIRDLPWACSAHAKDIYTSPHWEIQEKLDHCQWLTTCTGQNVKFLQPMCADSIKVMLNYHGLDLQRFSQSAANYSSRDGSDTDDPVVIISIGRAVEKKGYAGLLDALAGIQKELHWKLVHIGGGPLLGTLRLHARQLGIDQNIQWLGAQPQEVVLQHYRQSDFFVLNCCIDRFGDRDGLPNVMVEAQSQGLPVVATQISGIPELVEDRVNGLLVNERDTAALTNALIKIITSPDLRQRLGRAGQDKVVNQFEMNASFGRLEQNLRKLVSDTN